MIEKKGNGANLGFENQFWATTEIEDDGIPYEEKMAKLSTTLYEQFVEADQLDATIKNNLEVLGFRGQS